jgi:protein SCO1/2
MKRGRLSTGLQVLLLLAVAILVRPSDPTSALPYYRSAELTPEWLAASVADDPAMHHIAEFSFVDQYGDGITEADLDGRLTVANFFFTQCTGICPTTRAQMGWVREQFDGDDRLIMLSHSVMPDHDTHDVLHDYAHAHDVADGWHLLSGSEREVLEVAARDYFVNLRDGSTYGVENLQHTENVVLLDAQRRIRGVYNGTLRVDMQRLVEDVRVLMAEEGWAD